MKKFIMLILTLLLFSCTKGRESVSLIIYNGNDPFINSMANNIERESSDLFNIEKFDSKNFQINQNEFINQCIDNKTSLIMLNPVDRLGVYPIIRKLKANNIPVILFNREPLKKDLDIWEKAFYVGTKGEQSAQIQGEIIYNLFGSNPLKLNNLDKNSNNEIEIVILKGEQGHQDAEIRTTEVVNSLKSKGYKLNILVTEVANWKRSEAYEKMKAIINKYGNSIELVISNNDEMAIGGIDALIESNMFQDLDQNGIINKETEPWIPVVGIDGLQEAIILVRNGYLAGTVVNDSVLQAKAIVELANILLHNKSLTQLTFDIIDNKYIMLDYRILQ
ncbi:MAG: galactose ABC transporter substrate-binding protein [Spirochaetales bacterium]|nr:galactose ABC transporter substrate-binding protein [Spirochaetales bacterium]